MKYYALHDLQNVGNLMATGRNTTNLIDLKKELLNYIDPDIDDLNHYAKLSVKELANMWDFEILSQSTMFPENY